ncbi:hypothetical protein [Amycolatopsis sp. NPDC051128]|uniref:hypothetical protein n=1 Tax=Amycolatopsis sp. NPDC051128 TaxID=3155412 RepID=UPI00343B5A3F
MPRATIRFRDRDRRHAADVRFPVITGGPFLAPLPRHDTITGLAGHGTRLGNDGGGALHRLRRARGSPRRQFALWLAIPLRGAIALFMGLISFGMVMIAAVALAAVTGTAESRPESGA